MEFYNFIVLKPTVIAIPFFAALIAIETYLSVRDEKTYDRKDVWTNIALGFGSVAFGAVFAFIQAFFYEGIYQNLAPYQMPMNAWWTWVILFFVDDFAYYFFHRVSHESRSVLEFSRRPSFFEAIQPERRRAAKLV